MIAKPSIPAYILCGGKSSRMQREKGLVLLHNKAFIHHIINCLESITDSIFLVTSNTDYKQFNLPLVGDVYPERGPLGGIHAALKHTSAGRILILSCDIPLITKEILKQLILKSEMDKKSIYFTVTEDKWHPLIGIYSKNLLEDLDRTLKENRLKVIDFIKSQTYREVNVADAAALTNINTPQDLVELEKHL